MRPVYTVQFHLAHEGQEPDALFKGARSRIAAWISNSVQRRTGQPAQISEKSGESKIPPDATLSVEDLGEVDGSAIWNAVYTHPGEPGQDLVWQTRVTVSKHAGIVEFWLALLAGQGHYVLSPLRPNIGRPGIVVDLLKSFKCVVGGRVITNVASQLRDADVREFVDKTLQAPSRRLPVVVVSRTFPNGNLLVSPSALADRLAGLAEVYELETVDAAFRLTDELSKPLSCYNGAVRIYWPRFQVADSPFRHPLYLPEQIVDWAEAGFKPEPLIANKAILLSAAGFVEGEVTRAARATIKAQVQAKFLKGLQSITSLEQSKKSILELDARIKEKDEIIKSLQERVGELERQFATYAQVLSETVGPEEKAAQPAEIAVVDDVQSALLAAEKQCPILDVWGSAKESAGKSTAKQFKRVLEALQILASVAADYFDAQKKGKSLGGTLEETFARRGAPKYAGQDSDTTTTKFGSQRRFTQGSRQMMFKKHFTIGGGSRENCVQIYFELEEKTGRVIVGYCGVHLDYVGART